LVIDNILTQLEKTPNVQTENLDKLCQDIQLLKTCATKTKNPTKKSIRLNLVDKLFVRVQGLKTKSLIPSLVSRPKSQAVFQVEETQPDDKDSLSRNLLQAQILKQDSHLDEMSQMLEQLRTIGENIKIEIYEQDKIIDETIVQVDKTNRKMSWLNKSIGRFTSKVKNDVCCQFAIIIVCSALVIILGALILL
jgi:hypothetical protein